MELLGDDALKKVKEEFIFGSYKNMVMGDKYNMIEIK